MHRTKSEKMRDDLIGEAVLLILKDNGPINFKTLAVKLKIMASIERDVERRGALSAAALEVEQKVKSSSGVQTEVRSHCYVNRMHHFMVTDTQHKYDKKH